MSLLDIFAWIVLLILVASGIAVYFIIDCVQWIWRREGLKVPRKQRPRGSPH
jgi:hypothetical protein